MTADRSQGDPLMTLIKHILDLQPNDFVQNPIWVCAYNTDLKEPWYEENPADEVTYMPWGHAPPYDYIKPSHRSVLLAATFTLPHERVLPGYCGLPAPQWGAPGLGLSHMQPTMFWEGKAIGFWMGAVDAKTFDRMRSEAYGLLRGLSQPLFPIKYAIRNDLVDYDFSGMIDGFGRLAPPDFKNVEIAT